MIRAFCLPGWLVNNYLKPPFIIQGFGEQEQNQFTSLFQEEGTTNEL